MSDDQVNNLIHKSFTDGMGVDKPKDPCKQDEQAPSQTRRRLPKGLRNPNGCSLEGCKKRIPHDCLSDDPKAPILSNQNTDGYILPDTPPRYIPPGPGPAVLPITPPTYKPPTNLPKNDKPPVPGTGPATSRPKKVPKSRRPVPGGGPANEKKGTDNKDPPRPKKIPKSRKNQRGKKLKKG
jgi:hypothetical protein